MSRHNLALPSVAAVPPPAAKPLAVQSFEVRAGGASGPRRRCLGRVGMGPTREPRPRPQVKVGKSQRAALTVDVESGTVAITKRGSGSPEETIPQDKSKELLTPHQLLTGHRGTGGFPGTGLMPGRWAAEPVAPRAPTLCCLPTLQHGVWGPLLAPSSRPAFSPAADQIPERAEQGEAGV